MQSEIATLQAVDLSVSRLRARQPGAAAGIVAYYLSVKWRRLSAASSATPIGCHFYERLGTHTHASECNCPSGTLPLFNNLPGDHDSTATTNRNRSVTESHARFTTASEREGGVNRGALRLQNGQVVESLRVGSVPVAEREGCGAARERDASPLEGSLRHEEKAMCLRLSIKPVQQRGHLPQVEKADV